MELTRDNYFSHEMQMKYFGSSQLKDFLECPSMAMAKLNGEYDCGIKECFTQGHLMDSLFEGELDDFIANNPQIISKSGASKGSIKKAYQKGIDDFNFVLQDDVFMKYCLGEQQQIFVGEIEGVPFKIMIDSLLPNIIVDRKYLKDMADGWDSVISSRVPFFMKLRYDIQGAIYPEIYRQCTDKKLPFALAVITKENVPDHDVILLSEELLEQALEEVKAYIQEFNAIKTGLIPATKCGKCDWCKSNKRIKSIRSSDEFFGLGNGEELEEENDNE